MPDLKDDLQNFQGDVTKAEGEVKQAVSSEITASENWFKAHWYVGWGGLVGFVIIGILILVL